MSELVGNEIFRGRGLTARFLFSYPISTVGNRKYRTRPVSQETEKKYQQLCDDMLDIQAENPKVLTLSEEADALSEQLHNDLEPRLGKDGDLEYMADWAGKLHGTVLRIAGLLHVVEGVSKNGKDFADIPFDSILTITEKTMAAAVEIGYYFLTHAQACYGTSNSSEAEKMPVYIMERLKKHKPEQFTTGELLRLCTKFKTVNELTEPLNVLIENRFIREFRPEYKGTGRQPGSVYKVNPALYKTSK